MIIENPDPETLAKWGPLAYVSEAERKQILNGAYGTFEPAIKRLEKEIKAMKKQQKMKADQAKRFARQDEMQRTKG